MGAGQGESKGTVEEELRRRRSNWREEFRGDRRSRPTSAFEEWTTGDLPAIDSVTSSHSGPARRTKPLGEVTKLRKSQLGEAGAISGEGGKRSGEPNRRACGWCGGCEWRLGGGVMAASTQWAPSTTPPPPPQSLPLRWMLCSPGIEHSQRSQLSC